jgi:hypothetical protein
MPELRTYVENAKYAAKLDATLRRISGLLRSLTEVSKTASQDLINRDFASRFEKECRTLRTPGVELGGFSGAMGTTAGKPAAMPQLRADLSHSREPAGDGNRTFSIFFFYGHHRTGRVRSA